MLKKKQLTGTVWEDAVPHDRDCMITRVGGKLITMPLLGHIVRKRRLDRKCIWAWSSAPGRLHFPKSSKTVPPARNLWAPGGHFTFKPQLKPPSGLAGKVKKQVIKYIKQCWTTYRLYFGNRSLHVFLSGACWTNDFLTCSKSISIVSSSVCVSNETQ